MAENQLTRWTHQLKNGLRPDSGVTVEGFIPRNVERFAVNLDVNSRENVALHFNPRFDCGTIVRNSKEEDEWRDEEDEGELTLAQGGGFEIKILSLEEGFHISVNGTFFTYFDHRLPPDAITHVRVCGGVELKSFTYESEWAILPLEETVWENVGGHMKVVETCSALVIPSDIPAYGWTADGCGGQVLNGGHPTHGTADHDTDWTHHLKNGLPPDSCVTVKGFIPRNAERFEVNLDVNSSEKVALHFNPRFDCGKIVLNSTREDEYYYQDEEEEGELTLAQGGGFEIKILSLEEGFQISIDGRVFTYFDHRMPPHAITHVRVWGVELKRVTYESKEPLFDYRT